MLRCLPLALLALACGCTAKQTLLEDLPPPRLVAPDTATSAVKGVEISPKGKNPTWTISYRRNTRGLATGDQIPLIKRKRRPPDGPEVVATWSEEKPPKTGTLTRWASAKDAWNASRNSPFTRVFFEYLPEAPGETTTLKELANASADYGGAYDVWVKTPWTKLPLHGRLLLCEALDTAQAREVKRTWSITITQRQAIAAEHGKGIMLACKPYDGIVKVKGVRYVRPGPSKAVIDEEEFYKRIRMDGVTWALWLSNKPFPPAPEKKSDPSKDLELDVR